MSIHTFDRDLAVPAGANHLGQAERVIRVGFVDLKAERSLGVPSVHADDEHAASAQAERQPIGELSGLQTNSSSLCVSPTTEILPMLSCGAPPINLPQHRVASHG